MERRKTDNGHWFNVFKPSVNFIMGFTDLVAEDEDYGRVICGISQYELTIEMFVSLN